MAPAKWLNFMMAQETNEFPTFLGPPPPELVPNASFHSQSRFTSTASTLIESSYIPMPTVAHCSHRIAAEISQGRSYANVDRTPRKITWPHCC
jgi:hypothetical protein